MVTDSHNFSTRTGIGKVAGNRHYPSLDALTSTNTPRRCQEVPA